MSPFDFKLQNHFVASSDGTTLKVYELTNHTTAAAASSIRKIHWREVAHITPRDYNDADDDADSDNEGGEDSIDGLLFFDGHGRITGRSALTKLAQHLRRLRLLVSPEGYCFQDVKDLGEYSDFGIHYLRLNDLFSWPHHGVDLATTATPWARSELKYTVVSNKHNVRDHSNHNRNNDYDYKKVIESKDKELEELRSQLSSFEEAREELDKLRKKDSEMRRKKDEELHKLRKEKDELMKKLRKLREEKEDNLIKAMEEKEDEFVKLREEKEEELLKLQTKLEICQRNSWVKPPISKILLHLPKEKLLGIHLKMRRRVSPETFRVKVNAKTTMSPCQYYTPEIKEGSMNVLFESLLLLDEEEDEVASLMSPPRVDVGTKDGQFDTGNWWFAKTTAPEGGVTMIAYYEGDLNRVKVSRIITRDAIPLPYANDANFRPGRSFLLVSLVVGIRLAFLYRS
ncbi:hypothetical protein LINPERPRIM_LOCUS29900 [Linum perenne]